MGSKTSAQEKEFLLQSNLIEREPSEQALNDAIAAWSYAKKFVTMEMTVDHVLEIHRILMKHLNPRIAGKIRNCDVYIGSRRCKKEPEEDIRKKIEYVLEVMDTLKDPTGQLPGVLQPFDMSFREKMAKALHVQFEEIHPFEDGNGRTGRILLNIHRLRLGLEILVIPADTRFESYYPWFA